MPNILATITAHKRATLSNLRDVTVLEPSQRSFYHALNKPEFAFIMECKKASPSKGLIRESFDLQEIVPVYDRYADAVSVLTEERFFQGSFANLQRARKLTDKPILCKDFILEPKQVRLARHYGADAVLLMLSILNDQDYARCHAEAEKLNMDVLTEVHSEKELERAIKLGSKIIGINNRNLKDLTTDLNNTHQLSAKIPKDRLVVTESGINNHHDVLKLAPFADACLVGSSLMSQQNLAVAARELVYGDIKICGLTNRNDFALLEQSEASQLGIIFAESSKRKVNGQLQIENSSKPLIGVFQDQSIGFILKKCQQFKLNKIQLHGDEDQSFINKLRKELAADVLISKVLHVNGDIKLDTFENIDEYLLDSQSDQQKGGTGKCFNWQLLNQLPLDKNRYRIAGGVNADNIQQLKQLGFSKIDICGGSELDYGKKCPYKLAKIFEEAKSLSRTNSNKITRLENRR